MLYNHHVPTIERVLLCNVLCTHVHTYHHYLCVCVCSCREEMAHHAQVLQLQEETIASLIQEVYTLYICEFKCMYLHIMYIPSLYWNDLHVYIHVCYPRDCVHTCVCVLG